MANNFPTIIPSLNLQFANTGALPPDVTFTRASQSGGYYDGVTVVKAEENLFIRSQEFANAAWIIDGVTLSTVAAPDGTSTASKMLPTAVSAAHYIYGAASNRPKAASTTYTKSVRVKADGYGFVTISIAGTSSAVYVAATFDLSGAGAVTKTGVGGSGGTLVGTSITALASGWYQCAVIGSVTTAAGFDLVSVATTGTPTYGNYGLETFTGDGVSAIQIWGAQVEQRSFATAYTPTTTQPITNYIPKMLFAPAGVPVFDHNPVTGEALGLSVWEARTNLLQRSEEFDNAYWTKVGATVSANQVIAPDGTLSMDKLVEDTATSGHSVQGTGVSVTSGIVYTFTIYAKAAERSFIRINGNSTGLIGAAYYNLSTGALGTVASGTTASIVNVGNGIYRCVFTRTSTATTSVQFLVSVTNANNVSSYLGDGYSGIYIWGAQLEAGAFATPYIPTVASTVARSADAAVMTGVNFSRWFNAGAGAFVVNSTGLDTSFTVALQIDDGTTNNRIGMIIPKASSASPAFIFTGGAAQTAFSNVTFVGDDKEALSYAANNVLLSANGAAVQTDTTVVLPVVDRLRIRNNSAAPSSGYVKSIQYYPIALTSAQLQAVTA